MRKDYENIVNKLKEYLEINNDCDISVVVMATKTNIKSIIEHTGRGSCKFNSFLCKYGNKTLQKLMTAYSFTKKDIKNIASFREIIDENEKKGA